MNWLRWQIYRLWIGCREADCTHYWTWPSHQSVGTWHEFVHYHFLEEREWPHYGMVTPEGDNYARRHQIFQYAPRRQR